MNQKKILQLERLLNRELTSEEIEQLRRIKDVLEISDNDALWDIIVAMEYQRTYYNDIPEKITKMVESIYKELPFVAEKEVSQAQSRLSENVVEYAKTMSKQVAFISQLAFGTLTLVALLIYGALLLWAGYSIGSGQTHPPVFILQMPVGIIVGGLLVAWGFFSCFIVAKGYSEGRSGLIKYILAALAYLVIGSAILSFVV